MKKSLVASGFMGIVASLLGVAAVGCSAESGDYAETEVGSTSEALTCGSAAADLKDAVDDALTPPTDVSPDPSIRQFAASCVINDNGTDKMLVAGGFDNSQAALSDVFIGTPGGTSWRRVASLSNARGMAKMIQVPGDTSKCLIVGGTDQLLGGNFVTQSEVFTANGGEGAWANGGAITGRILFGLVPTLQGDANHKVLLVGGATAVGGTGASTDLQSWDPVNNDWDTEATALPLAVRDFAIASQDSSFDKFLVAGGQLGNNNPTTHLQAIKVSGSTYTAVDLTSVSAADALSTARIGAMAFPITSAVIKVAAGDSGSAVLQKAQDVTVDWTDLTVTGTTSVATEQATEVPTAVRNAPIVFDASGNVFLVSGANHTTGAVNSIQKFTLSGATWSSIGSCFDRRNHVAEFLSSEILAGTGKINAGTLRTDFQRINP